MADFCSLFVLLTHMASTIDQSTNALFDLILPGFVFYAQDLKSYLQPADDNWEPTKSVWIERNGDSNTFKMNTDPLNATFMLVLQEALDYNYPGH